MSIYDNNKSFCTMPFNSVFYDFQSKVRPCCLYRGKKEDYSVNRFQNIITDILDEKMIDGCQNCYMDEKAGRKSLRHHARKHSFIEIEIGNYCNLACKMCSGGQSTTFQKTWENKNILIETNLDPIINSKELLVFNEIRLIGGEPLLNKNFYKILNFLKENNRFDIIFGFSTNITFFPKQNIIDILNQFKDLQITLSLDGIGQINDYIRFKSKWDHILEILHQWKKFEKPKYDLHTVVSALNVHQLPELGKFIEEFEFSKFHWSLFNIKYPEELRINNLPKSYKEIVASKLENYIGIRRDFISTIKNNLLDDGNVEILRNFIFKYDKDILLKDINSELSKLLY